MMFLFESFQLSTLKKKCLLKFSVLFLGLIFVYPLTDSGRYSQPEAAALQLLTATSPEA